MLRFGTALFPLLLVSITHAVFEFHTCYKCVPRFVTAYNLRHSIIHAYATFAMLSIFSTMCKAYAILLTSLVIDNAGNVKGTVLQLEPDIRMYSHDHIPYVIFSLSLIFILVVCPGLLISTYPTSLYGKYFSKCLSARKQLAIKIFVETVNCGFKDGLNGTHDYRMIPGIIILLALAYSVIVSILYPYIFSATPLLVGMIMILSSLLVSYLRPCKDLLTNMSLSLNLLLLGVLSFFLALWWEDMLLNSEFLASLIITLTFIPHVTMLFWVLYRVLQRFNCLSRCIEFVQRQPLYQTLRSFRLQQTAADTSDDDDELQPLLRN